MAFDLTSRGFSAASLWVLRENAVARAFYERFGGQVIYEREDVRGGATLVEVAYGWANLKTFGAAALGATGNLPPKGGAFIE
jgi:ribosomal protein S18 acetylase RimI-like enzyme